MNIAERYDLLSIVRELEVVMQVDASDYEERDMATVVRNVKTRINRQYHIDLTEYKIDAPEMEVSSDRAQLSIFIENVKRIHASLCGYLQISRYKTYLPISLADINYLGYTKESLSTTLKALQREKFIYAADSAIDAIADKLGTVSMCVEKRLFLLIIVAYNLGLNEIVSALAELLYLAVLR